MVGGGGWLRVILVLSLSLKLNKKDVQLHKKSIHVVISILAMLPQLENLEQLLTRPRANKIIKIMF